MIKTVVDHPQAIAPAPSVLVRGVLLALLPLVAVLVYVDGLRYDPGVLEFKSQAVVDMVPADYFPQNWGGLKQVGTLRRFDKSNLYEYINGHAEFFLGAGFRTLAVAEYNLNAAGEPLATMEIYHMGKSLHAFGTLMDETGEGANPVAVGGMGFRSGRDLRFINGPYYIKISVFADGVPLEKGAAALVESMGDAVGKNRLEFDFPDLGEVVSTRFVKENYMGLDFLKNVIERTFQKGEQQFNLDSAVRSTYLTQPIDSPGKTGEVLVTNKVTAISPVSPDKSIDHAVHALPAAESRFKAFLLVAEEVEIKKTAQQLLAFLKQDGIEYSESKIDGLAMVLVSDRYEGDWFYITANKKLLGVFGMGPEKIVVPLKRFAKNGKKTPEEK
jgi:hypothetical protein